MQYEKLGKTDLTVSRIGFGCWAIGGHGYGPVDDQESIRVIRKALSLGINFFDTADVYGFGHSEELLGKALGSEKNSVVIATKFGVNWDERGRTFRDTSPQRVVKALEGSLRRLKVDCIQLYQIHWFDGRTPIFETMEALKKCQAEGKIRYIGCCNFSFERVREACNSGQVESNQLIYSVIDRGFEEDIEKCSRVLGIGTIVYSVLARGLLSGKYKGTTQFGEKDTRARDPNFQGERLTALLRVVDKLQQLGIRYAKSPGQTAIRWVLDNPCVTSAIIGAKTLEQVLQNVGALCWKLELEDRQSLTDAV